MTSQERRTYSDKTLKQFDRLSKAYYRPVYDALKSQVDKFISDMRAHGLQRAHSNLHTVVTNEELAPVLNQLHIDSGLFFGRKAWREIYKDAKTITKKSYIWLKAGFGFNDKWTQDIITYFQQDLFSTVSDISDTTRNQVLSVLDQALKEGWSIDQIAEKLQSPELLIWRARLIARTELVKGSFIGRQLAAQDSEWETSKEWIAANDHRTRHSHRIADGEIVDFGARFQVERPTGGVDMMSGPGDPKASAANICNCRCAMAIIAKRDERGRLIPKTTHLLNAA